jgi:hypothetical protein
MAKKYWDKEIDLKVNWGGDVSTSGLPVNGEQVQKVIKDGINSKVGYVGIVEAQGRQPFYVLTRDKETFEVYKTTITDDKPFGDVDTMDGVNGRFDAPFNYKMELNFIGDSESGYISKLVGNTGNIINFKAQTVDASNSPQGESVTVTIKVTNENGVEHTQTLIYTHEKASSGIDYNLDGKLSKGVNTIIVTAIGMNTGVSAMKRMTYRLVDIYFIDEFNMSQRYSYQESGILEINVQYSLKGVGETKVKWLFDGTEYRTTEYDNNPQISNSVESFTFTEQTDGKTWLQPGIHTLQMMMECEDIADNHKTPIYYREFIVESNTPLISEPCVLRKTSFKYENENSFISSVNNRIPTLVIQNNLITLILNM